MQHLSKLVVLIDYTSLPLIQKHSATRRYVSNTIQVQY